MAGSCIVTKEMAEEFLYTQEVSLSKLDSEKLGKVCLIDLKNKTVLFSFDKAWKPYIGFTRGYNRKERVSLEPCELTEMIKMAFRQQGRRPAGGRVHIKADSVFYKNSDRTKVELFRISEWQGDDPYKASAALLNTLEIGR